MATDTATRLTYDDYAALPDDGRRYELIDGELYVNPAPYVKHQIVSMNLALAIAPVVRANSLGHVFYAPTDVVLSEDTVVQPNLIFVSNARSGIITEKNIQGAPDLLIEIVSESGRKRDEITKRHLYEQHGVSEYWIVDPELELVKIYRVAPAGTTRAYVKVAEISTETGGELTTPLLPGLAIAIGDAFAS